MKLTVESAISTFGAKAKEKLSNPAAAGQPEDQLRAPFEHLLGDLAELSNVPRTAVAAVGESSVSDLKTRPDYAITVHSRGRVALIADSGGLYALYDSRDKNHRPVKEAVRAEAGPIILPVAILSELDYLLRVKLGGSKIQIRAEVRLLEGIVKGALTLEGFTTEDAARCGELIEQYSDLDLGLADASVIATAERLEVYRILTVDERDFRTVRTARGVPLVLVPADRRS